MKKTLFLLSIFLIISCAKDDDEKIIINQNENILYNLTVNESQNGRVSVSGGALTSDSQVRKISKGQPVTLRAVPDEGYRFESWSNGQTDDEITLNLINDLTITANFIQLQTYTISLNSDEGGNVILRRLNNGEQVSGTEFYEGTELRVEAIITEGYVFNGWDGTDSNQKEFVIEIQSNLDLKLKLTPLPFDINNMSIIKYHLYNKDTLSGKKVNDIKYDRNILDGSTHSFSVSEIQNNLDFLVSDNFIIWWDNRFNKTEMAIDILRWSEYSVIKLLEYGFDKPKDFDTHRINIFIRQEGGDIDIIPDEGQNYNYVSTYRNGRKHISYNSRDYNIIREYPMPPVIHEMVHVFQKNTNKINFNYDWYTEATAEYIDMKLLLPVNGHPASFKFADYLYSTNLLFWDDSSDTYHKYGLSLFFLYLDWINLFSPSMVADSYRESGITTGSNWNIESAFEFIKRKVVGFEDKYFEFALKSSVIDFDYREKIREAIHPILAKVNDLKNKGYKRYELVLESNEEMLEFYNPNNKVYDWGYQVYKIKSPQSDLNYRFEFDSNHENFRFGLVKEINNSYEYYEINKNSDFVLAANTTAYIIVFNVSGNKEKRLYNNTYDLYNPYEYSVKISKL